MALTINGRMKVKTLKAEFKDEFGLTLRVYDGRSFSDDNATLASIRKGDNKGGEFSPKRNTKVGSLEDKFMDLFGIKVQISGSDDSYLCDNNKTLAGALEADEKLMEKRASKNESEVNETEDDLVDVITYAGHSLPTEEEIESMKRNLNSWLEDYIDDSKDYWSETSDGDELPSFKVRVEWADEPNYFKYTFGYDKYYMNWVNGHYEYSLENMIYMAMLNMGYYENILHPDDYKEAVQVATDYPDSIYVLDFWDEEKDDAYSEYAEEANAMINEILYGAVQFVGEKLCSEYGIEAVDKFENLECQEEDSEEDQNANMNDGLNGFVNAVENILEELKNAEEDEDTLIVRFIYNEKEYEYNAELDAYQNAEYLTNLLNTWIESEEIEQAMDEDMETEYNIPIANIKDISISINSFL